MRYRVAPKSYQRQLSWPVVWFMRRLHLFFYTGETISHYTNLSGLFGIVESGGFWLSDHRFLNDAEEFENGRKLTNNLLKKLAHKSRYVCFKDVLLEAISQLESYSEDPYYVCSFSKKPDSLDQWRSYGGNGQGISITFDNARKSLSHFFAMPILTVSKVIYSDNDKIKLLLRTIRRYKKEYVLDLEYGNRVDVEDWGEYLARHLALEFINFKHPEYASEKEVRMAVSSSHLHHFQGIKHRVGKDCIIPYITSKDIYDESFEKHLGTDKLPIIEVRVGPAVNQDMTARSIAEYLACKGYSGVEVIKSDVPYRG
ncbi:DUF2971 domain-containing protein [Idiomarina sp.]|uniref:DUF2971 domain-containing protein n=1 Tax=Idiomarina sp. TaxID=1874361 RepID=UPI0025856605|nr:DUF2971 domain-containing protein [Idiomarina sp.]